MKPIEKRALGRLGTAINPLGLGCWAAGGEAWENGVSRTMGKANDTETIKAIHCAIDHGITLFDTADCYGAGHSEKVLGQALAGKRDKMIISTKFGAGYDEASKEFTTTSEAPTPEGIRQACDASLRRLNTDYIDLYFLHIWSLPKESVPSIRETLEELVKEGKVRGYGWSTDLPELAELMAAGENCVATQYLLNVVQDSPDMIDVCDRHNLAGINRTPLGMGLLTGKYGPTSQFSSDDIRGSQTEWIQTFFTDGKPNQDWLDKLDAIREILTSNGRTLTQGVLSWIWGRNDRTIPIPGFRTVKQVEENAKALQFGALTPDQIQEINRILQRS